MTVLFLSVSLVVWQLADDPGMSLQRANSMDPTVRPGLLQGSPSSPPFSTNYLVVILMENRNYYNIIGNQSAPYLNRLANDYGLSTNYYEVSGNRSLPNYLGIVAGKTYDSWSGCNLPPSQCTGWKPILDPTIMDRLETSGLTWKAYMEDMPSNCYQYNTAGYVPRHNPFVYFAKVLNSQAECNKVIPAGSKAANLIADLTSTSTASNFMWLTPNLCDDMHDCSTSVGDTYLSQIVPQILSSHIFQSQNAALFITWDEGSRGGNHMPAIWAGPSIKNNFTANAISNHYSALRTFEAIWNLPSLTANDAGARAMTEFFAPPKTSYTFTPTQPDPNDTVSFAAATANGVTPYRWNWTFGDGETSTSDTPSHSFSKSGQFITSLTVTDHFNHTSSFSSTINVATDPSIPSTTNPSPTSSRSSLLDWRIWKISVNLMLASSIITVIAGLFVSRLRKSNQARTP